MLQKLVSLSRVFISINLIFPSFCTSVVNAHEKFKRTTTKLSKNHAIIYVHTYSFARDIPLPFEQWCKFVDFACFVLNKRMLNQLVRQRSVFNINAQTN